MSPRTLIVLALAVVCGISAAVAVDQLSSRDVPDAKPETVAIVVAAVNVARGSTLTADLVRMREYPKEIVPAAAIAKLDDALDRSVIQPLERGEPVLDSKLAARDAGRGVAALVPPGMRAFTIHTATVESGVAGFILPGNRVDVLLTVSSAIGDEKTGGATTTTLLQNIEILAVDQRLDAPSDNRVDPKSLKSVTVVVTPDQAVKLSLGQTKGTLHLSLRNLEDGDPAETQPVTLADLRFRQEPPAPEPKQEAPPPPPPPVLQIRTLRGSMPGSVRLLGN